MVVPVEDQLKLVPEVEFGAVVEALEHGLEDKGQARSGAEVVLGPVGSACSYFTIHLISHLDHRVLGLAVEWVLTYPNILSSNPAVARQVRI